MHVFRIQPDGMDRSSWLVGAQCRSAVWADSAKQGTLALSMVSSGEVVCFSSLDEIPDPARPREPPCDWHESSCHALPPWPGRSLARSASTSVRRNGAGSGRGAPAPSGGDCLRQRCLRAARTRRAEGRSRKSSGSVNSWSTRTWHSGGRPGAPRHGHLVARVRPSSACWT
jgi:hypothetical protein